MAPSIWQLLILLVIVLLLFGTKRLSNLGSDLGSAIRGFRKAVGEGEQTPADTTPKQVTAALPETQAPAAKATTSEQNRSAS